MKYWTHGAFHMDRCRAVKGILNNNLDQIKGRHGKVDSDNKNVQSELKVGSRK